MNDEGLRALFLRAILAHDAAETAHRAQCGAPSNGAFAGRTFAYGYQAAYGPYQCDPSPGFPYRKADPNPVCTDEIPPGSVDTE